MSGRNRREVSRELSRVRDQFASWRLTRRPKARIPDRLWEKAAELVPTHGLHHVARTLQVDYYSLKKRIPVADGAIEPPRPDFVELPGAVSALRECVIEYEDAAGVSMRVSLKGYAAAEVAQVGRSLRTTD